MVYSVRKFSCSFHICISCEHSRRGSYIEFIWKIQQVWAVDYVHMSRCYVPRDAHRRVPEVSSVASLQIITVPHGVTVYIIIAGVFSSVCIVVWSAANSIQFGSCKIQQVLSRWLRACRRRSGGVFRGAVAVYFRFSRCSYILSYRGSF